MSDRTEKAAGLARDEVMAKANVVGVAGGDDKVLVLVTEKKPLDQLADHDVVPRRAAGEQTDVIEVGNLRPMFSVGASIGLHNGGTGTFGGLVKDEVGRHYVLTNNHVAADTNRARVLEPIYSPGPADGLGQRMGALARFEPIYFDRVNLIDAALVAVDDSRLSTVLRGSNHLPQQTATARVGWSVQKRGRTTGHNWGKVMARNATVDIWMTETSIARFTGQVITSHMLDPGDSGSVLATSGGFATGLGFAGSDAISIHTPINLVLRLLAVKFV